MMLEGSNSSTALGWVREDLDECLSRVRENLERFAEDTSERKPLSEVQDCLEQLHLTRGGFLRELTDYGAECAHDVYPSLVIGTRIRNKEFGRVKGRVERARCAYS